MNGRFSYHTKWHQQYDGRKSLPNDISVILCITRYWSVVCTEQVRRSTTVLVLASAAMTTVVVPGGLYSTMPKCTMWRWRNISASSHLDNYCTVQHISRKSLGSYLSSELAGEGRNRLICRLSNLPLTYTGQWINMCAAFFIAVYSSQSHIALMLLHNRMCVDCMLIRQWCWRRGSTYTRVLDLQIMDVFSKTGHFICRLPYTLEYTVSLFVKTFTILAYLTDLEFQYLCVEIGRYLSV